VRIDWAPPNHGDLIAKSHPSWSADVIPGAVEIDLGEGRVSDRAQEDIVLQVWRFVLIWKADVY
jgi:hypothetical protein